MMLDTIIPLDPPAAAPTASSDALKLDVEGKLDLTANDLTAQRVAILGSSGSGKSNLLALILEHMLPFMPFVIFDQHDEFWGLCEKYELLRVGKSAESQIKAGPEQAEQIAELSHSRRMSVVVEMLNMTRAERQDFVERYCARVWELNKIAKQPYGIVLEEAQNFIPEGKATPAQDMMKQFALEGRKFGFSIFISTQRSAEVSKSILAQCRIAFLHGVDIYPDVQAYAGMLPYTAAETKKIALSLGTGECIVKIKRNGPAQYYHPVKMKQRETFHVGDTPTLDHEAAPPLRAIDAALLDELAKLLAPKEKVKESTPILVSDVDKTSDILGDKKDPQNVQIEELRRELLIARAEIVRLAGELAAAKNGQKPDTSPDKSLDILQLITNGGADVQLKATSEAAEWDGRSELATSRARNKQRRDFEGLLLTIRDQKSIHRKILVYLLKREGQTFSETELARYLGYSKTSIQHGGYPNDLINRKLIRRGLTANRHEYTFQATVREKLVEMCPDLDIEPFIQQICKLEKV